jgi:hypothetical protein
MVDRANIKSILAEHKLTEEGLVNPANAKKLGEFAGVDAILMGNVTVLDDGIVLMVKAISTSSAQIVAAGRITFGKTSEIQQLGNRSVSGSTGVSSPAAVSTGERAGTSYQDATVIATKDIGSLRVVLKSVLPMKVKDQNGRSVNGIRCSFEFVNRETQRPIVVAMNAAPYRPPPSGALFGYIGNPRCIEGSAGTRTGDVLRTTLVDERGTVWSLSTSGVIGMSIVSVGKSSPSDVLSPTDIAAVLERQDKIGTNMTRDANCPQVQPFAFVFGSTAQIASGQSAAVTLSFVQDAVDSALGAVPKFFQINSEIVIGVTTGAKKSYSLYNLTFDRVSMPAF